MSVGLGFWSRVQYIMCPRYALPSSVECHQGDWLAWVKGEKRIMEFKPTVDFLPLGGEGTSIPGPKAAVRLKTVRTVCGVTQALSRLIRHHEVFATHPAFASNGSAGMANKSEHESKHRIAHQQGRSCHLRIPASSTTCRPLSGR